MPRVEELLTPQELIDYTKERQTEAYMGELLFPERKTEAMEIKMIKGASDLPVSAHIHAFDTETELGSREGADYSMQDLALIKKLLPLKVPGMTRKRRRWSGRFTVTWITWWRE